MKDYFRGETADRLFKELGVEERNTLQHVESVKNALDVEERKAGKWYSIGNSNLATCKCGFITDRYSAYNFCPNCGAKME